MAVIAREAILEDAATEISQRVQDEDGEPMEGFWVQDFAEAVVGRLADDYLGAVEACWALNDALVDLLRAHPGEDIVPEALWRAVELFQALAPERGQ